MHLLSKHAQAVCQWTRDDLSDESCYAELKMPSMSQNVACFLTARKPTFQTDFSDMRMSADAHKLANTFLYVSEFNANKGLVNMFVCVSIKA